MISAVSSLSLLLIILQCSILALAIDTANQLFNDPDVVQDWIFQMINIYPVWERGIFGKGIRIRVNDEGVDYRHGEFQDRFDTASSCPIFDVWFDETTRTYRNHGTVVASIIGAGANNGQCAMGIAPEVTLSSCRVIGAPVLDNAVFDHSYPAYKLDTMDIAHNSIGYVPCRRKKSEDIAITLNMNTCPFQHRADDVFVYNGTRLDNMRHPCDVCNFPSDQPNQDCSNAIVLHCQFYFEYDQEICLYLLNQVIQDGQCSFQSLKTIRASIEKGATEGRNGKGVIYVYASGNNYYDGDNTNFENFGRYPVIVSAVGKDGQHASYSTAGSSLLLTAPAGDFDDDVYRQTVARPGGGCALAEPGTSFSSPIVSGVIALMLQVNPELTWRDVQGILVTTAEPITHTLYEDTTRTVNGAGLIHSNLYGFGMVNAMAAVTAAETWKNYGPEQLVTAGRRNLNLKLPNDSSLRFTQAVVKDAPILVENVEVKLYLQHLTRGHLQITLQSPDGTVSELLPGYIPENGNTNDPWILRTVKSWGENPEGTWTLSIVDRVPGDLSNCADKPIEITQGFSFGCNTLELLPNLQNKGLVTTAQNLFDQGVLEGCCACSGGFFCQDTLDSATCLRVQQTGICSGGNVLYPELGLMFFEDENGQSMRDACCILGGGTTYQDPNDFEDKLLGWELNIYGHPDPSRTKAPTMRPTFSPTKAPVTISGGASSLKTWVLTALGFVVCLIASN